MNKRVFRILFLVLFGMQIAHQETKAQAPANCEDVMYQAFYWDGYSDASWTTLNGQVNELSQNFSLIWLPVSGKSSWMGYMPQWWFDQNSAFGAQGDLKTLIANLKAKGTGCIADIVVNHRDRVSGSFPTESYKGVSYPLGNEAIVRNEGGSGATDTGDDFGGNGVPDLDHNAASVQTTIKAYLDFLKTDMGYIGWRYDMVKGYSGSFVGIYNNASNNYFSVGEYWDSSFDLCKAWVTATGNTSTVFDFPGKYAINKAWSTNNMAELAWMGQPAGLISNVDTKRYAVSFIDNHDTGRSDNTSRFTGDVLGANAFILSSPGVPCVWMSHWLPNKAKISEMIAARKLVRLHSQSTSTVLKAQSDLYVAETVGFNGSLIVKIGSGSYSAPVGYTLATSGNNYAIWTKATGPVAPKVIVSPVGGLYIGGTTVTLSSSNGTAPVKIYYTTNGTTPSASSTLYSAPFSITANNTVLQAIAIDNAGVSSPVVSNTYLTTKPAEIVLKFTAPATWAKVGCYVWTGVGTALAGAWPGTDITSSAVNGVYSFTVTNTTILPVNVVFNNFNLGEQSVDLSTSSTTCWSVGSGSGTNPKKYAAVVIQCTTSLPEALSAGQISIFPNPAEENITIDSALDLESVQIYSISGVLVKSQALSSSNAQISLANLAAGYYNLVVMAHGQRYSSKLIKR